MINDLVVQTNTDVSLLPSPFQKNCYIPTEARTYEQWVEDGNLIEQAEGSVAWWIGDWMNYGEKTYGDEKYKQAMDWTGFEYQAIANYKWVASSVQSSTRVENLSWAHHRLVAKYTDKQQSLLLGKASELDLSVKQFKEKIPRLLLVLPENVHIYHGDFYELVQKVEDESIDLIITDPPYNVANEREFILDGRSNISQDFGPWDKYEHQQFIDLFTIWAQEWKRILRDQGSGYVFTSDTYISYLRRALEDARLHVKATIIWHKPNPGTQIVKTSFKSSVEYILFFTKGEGGHTFHWQGENEMHNHIETPICGGNERIKGKNNETLHPTQKPEALIKHLMSISSNPGETVFDGFAGVGTVGKIAIEKNCGFIGIEQEEEYFLAMEKRLAE